MEASLFHLKHIVIRMRLLLNACFDDLLSAEPIAIIDIPQPLGILPLKLLPQVEKLSLETLGTLSLHWQDSDTGLLALPLGQRSVPACHLVLPCLMAILCDPDNVEMGRKGLWEPWR